MTEQELLNQNTETFRDENSDAWKLKGKTRAAEARGFFANIISSVYLALLGKANATHGHTISEVDNLPTTLNGHNLRITDNATAVGLRVRYEGGQLLAPDGSVIGAPISVTYAELIDLIAANNLEVDRNYKITDFQSYTLVNGIVTLSAVNPLLVKAISKSILAEIAYFEYESILYRYDVNNNSVEVVEYKQVYITRTDTDAGISSLADVGFSAITATTITLSSTPEIDDVFYLFLQDVNGNMLEIYDFDSQTTDENGFPKLSSLAIDNADFNLTGNIITIKNGFGLANWSGIETCLTRRSTVAIKGAISVFIYSHTALQKAESNTIQLTAKGKDYLTVDDSKMVIGKIDYDINQNAVGDFIKFENNSSELYSQIDTVYSKLYTTSQTDESRSGGSTSHNGYAATFWAQADSRAYNATSKRGESSAFYIRSFGGNPYMGSEVVATANSKGANSVLLTSYKQVDNVTTKTDFEVRPEGLFLNDAPLFNSIIITSPSGINYKLTVDDNGMLATSNVS